MEESTKNKILKLYDDGELEELHEILAPYVANGEPFALHINASFSLAGSMETEAEYSKRYVEQMKKASEGGIAAASYRMGVNHLYGDDVKQDYKLASMYFERAIAQGDSYTKFTYGFSIYYGTDENPQDKVRGLKLMQEAAAEGIEKAARELELISKSQ
ncbi:tetratricopeptide repeat protein [Corallincola platygyrae]|uniref:Tetratricopeptide repeat protein n=1 Tax=Corallincola platygyrae TaxID=1193278 RepID=A0ABW4XGH3_9GAMM